jgi:hypothetical protein
MRLRLGELAGVVWLVADLPGGSVEVERRLATLCRGSSKRLEELRGRAQLRLRRAHEAWGQAAQEVALQWVA